MKKERTITQKTLNGFDAPDDLKAFIEQSLDDDKGFDIVTIDMDSQTALADYMIIASGSSSRHVQSMAQRLKDKLNIHGLKGINVEGLSRSDWVVLDAGDVIVHLFRPEVREFYDMEKMWGIVQRAAPSARPTDQPH